MKNFILLFLLSLIVSACNKQEEVDFPFDNSKFYENHEAANWTKETAKEHLQGRWMLIYTYCCPMSENRGWKSVEEDFFVLQFEQDSVKVFKNSTLEQTQYWEFNDQNEESLHLETEELISNTFGTIYFYEDFMLFNGSPLDGPDNYFQKVK
ncbi:hypothetical protein [Marivirga sp.]|uniref:hypothetical protein n=1 Tax=Marivirga sp. TaxID=2018662 RepID=UPI002D7E6A09|nr:hypothetical protein [Marivirga sp.]HET8859982.1 hypothetical protein [Marivirga sp.]